eukprot:scaffold18427_cov61-Phaeocystis_antarctica.AAC.10
MERTVSPPAKPGSASEGITPLSKSGSRELYRPSFLNGAFATSATVLCTTGLGAEPELVRPSTADRMTLPVSPPTRKPRIRTPRSIPAPSSTGLSASAFCAGGTAERFVTSSNCITAGLSRSPSPTGGSRRVIWLERESGGRWPGQNARLAAPRLAAIEIICTSASARRGCYSHK